MSDTQLHSGIAESPPSLLGDDRGAAYTEYVIVLVLVTLVGGFAIAALGLPLIEYYRDLVAAIVSPVP